MSKDKKGKGMVSKYSIYLFHRSILGQFWKHFINLGGVIEVGAEAPVGRVRDHAVFVDDVNARGRNASVQVGDLVRLFVAVGGLHRLRADVKQVQQPLQSPLLLDLGSGQGLQGRLGHGLGRHENGAEGQGKAAVGIVERLQNRQKI